MPEHVVPSHNTSLTAAAGRLLPWLVIVGVSLAVAPAGCRAEANEPARGTTIEMSADGGASNTASTSVRKLPDGRTETIKKSKTVARRATTTGEIVTTSESFERTTSGQRAGIDIGTYERRSRTVETTYEPRAELSKRR